MDASNKKVALVPEVTQGTIPATPGFLVLRDTMTTGGLIAPWTESPERRNDRMLGTTVKGLRTLGKKITMPFAQDAALDQLFQSFMCGAWTTNTLLNGSALQPFTLEEVHEAPTATPGPWFRSAGCIVDQMAISLATGKEGTCVFDLFGFGETTAAAAIAGATYAAPSTLEPMTPIDIVVNSFFGIVAPAPKMMSLQFTAKNNLRRQYNWGSPDIYRTGLGSFRVDVQAQFYFDSLAQYAAISPGALGVLDFTIGSTTLKKYQIVLPNAKISNPALSDGGNSTDVMLSCNLNAEFDAGTSAALKIVRVVA